MNIRTMTLAALMGAASTAAQADDKSYEDRALWGSIANTPSTGTIAIGDSYTQDFNKILISWRMLPGDNENTSFDLYRKVGDGKEYKVNAFKAITATNYQLTPGTTKGDQTFRLTYHGETQTIGTCTMKQSQIDNRLPYISIPLQSTLDINDTIRYCANDVSVGDLDGDGQMEIVVKRIMNVAHNLNIRHPLLWEAYKLDGTFMWRIKSGPNTMTGNMTSFAIADFDGDGKDEIGMRTAEGMVFGDGDEIPDTDGDGKTDYRRPESDLCSAGPEFLSIIDGTTGRELARTDYIRRGKSDDWGIAGTPWKLANSHRIGVGSFDETGLPSVILGRGVYGRSVIEAWDWRSGQLTRRFHFDTNDDAYGKDGKHNSTYAGQGNHSISVADLDGDGLDEIFYGSMALDHDGVGLWNSQLGHGDANHVGKFLTDREGLQCYHCLENGTTEVALHDAKTGEIIWSQSSEQDGDMGRCCVGDIDPNSPGCEFWKFRSNAYSQDGKDLGYSAGAANMMIWFDGSLNRQNLNEGIITSYTKGRTFNMRRYDMAFINGTKSNPSWYGDITGDWREELIVPDTTLVGELKVFATWYPTTHRIPWLMTDHCYYNSAKNENIGYNQPTHTGYYLGSDWKNDQEIWAEARKVLDGKYRTTTDIQGVAETAVRSDKPQGIYNLMGQKVATPTDGLYIINGKKVIKKR